MLCFALAHHLLSHLHSRLTYHHLYLFGCLSHLSYQALVLQMRIQAALRAGMARVNTAFKQKITCHTLLQSCAGKALMLWWPISCICCLETENKGRLERRGEIRLCTDEWPGEEESSLFTVLRLRRTRGPQQYCQVGSLETKWKEKCVMTWLSYRTCCTCTVEILTTNYT